MTKDMSESRFRRRTSSHNLRLDIRRASLANDDLVWDDNASGKPDRDEVMEEGQQLFHNFLAEELRREGINAKQISTPIGYRNPLWAKTGRELRLLADEFSKTKKRQQVRTRAQLMEIDGGVEYHQFHDLLYELCLSGGLTQERIVVLFFFCSDLAIRLLKQSADFFSKCLTWSYKFINERVCTWVQQHGGWEVVLCSSLEYFMKNTFFWLSIACISAGVVRWISRRE